MPVSSQATEATLPTGPPSPVIDQTRDPSEAEYAAIEARIAYLRETLSAAPFKPASTVVLPGTKRGSDALAGEGPQDARLIFLEAVASPHRGEYAGITGLNASAEQIRQLRVALFGGEASDAGGIDYGLESPESDPIQRSLVQYTGMSEPVAIWVRVERKSGHYGVTAAGRDASWEPRLLQEYVRLQDYQSDHLRVGKPVIYLYPQQLTTVRVRLSFEGRITTSAPAITESLSGWQVRAEPDGTITDANGTTWPYLFWEGVSPATFDLSTGFVVERERVDVFLAKSLAQLGLSPSESAEFREYWVPRMRGSRYSLVHFEGPAYERLAPLTVQPKPHSEIRVFMVFKPLDTPRAVQPQVLRTPERTGFTVVEWGGTKVTR